MKTKVNRRDGPVIHLLRAWQNITDDLPAGTPTTFAKPDGIGALQISHARYLSGEAPQVTLQQLQAMLGQRVDSLGLTAATRSHGRYGETGNLYARADLRSPKEAITIWYLSNGRDVSFMTYTTLDPEHPDLERELAEATAIVERLEV